MSEQVYHADTVTGVSFDLYGAMCVVLELLDLMHKRDEFSWRDENQVFDRQRFTRNQGYMWAYLGDERLSFRVYWRQIQP